MGSSQRVLLTVVICIAILMAWQFLFSPPPKDPQNGKGPPATPAAKTAKRDMKGSEAPSGQPEHKAPRDPKTASVAEARAPEPNEVLTRITTGHAIAVFSNRGAVLKSWKLRDPRFQEQLAGKLEPVDLVKMVKSSSKWPFMSSFADSDAILEPNTTYALSKQTEREIHYEWSSDAIRVLKSYTLDKDHPTLELKLQVENKTPKPINQRLELALFNRQDPTSAKASFTNPYPIIPTVSCYVNGSFELRSHDAIIGSQSSCSAGGCGMGEGPINQTGEVLWIGAGDRYFLTAIVPSDVPVQRRCGLDIDEASSTPGELSRASLLYPKQTIAANGQKVWTFSVFIGPKELHALDRVKGPQNSDSHLGTAIEFGWLEVLCRPMLWLLKTFHSWFGNWGLSIILLTIVVKLLTLYWTHKSMLSMKQMSKLKPEMDLLREKYGEDKQRLNQEMMNLYKVHKVNPLGGCLPMLIQMPIWFALYRTLGNAVELYRSSFVGWITDLTAPDPYYILPIAMGASMFAQQAITPQPMEGAQAKMMKYFMPGMFTVMMLALPSGLTLYIFVNTILSMVHQFYLNKKFPNLPMPERVNAPRADQDGGTGDGSRASTAYDRVSKFRRRRKRR